MNTFDLFIFAFLCSLTPMLIVFGAVPAYLDTPAPVAMVKTGRVYSVWLCVVCTFFVLLSSIATTIQ